MGKAGVEQYHILYMMVWAGLCEESSFEQRPDEREGCELCRYRQGRQPARLGAEGVTKDRVLQSGKQLRENRIERFLPVCFCWCTLVFFSPGPGIPS